MTCTTAHRRVLALAARQHGVVARWQMLALGMSRSAIEEAIRAGRSHRVMRGVYAVGRPELTRRGFLVAAVLRCGQQAALSHHSAAELWRIRRARPGAAHVCVPAGRGLRTNEVRVHRRDLGPREITQRDGIRVTTPVCTLVDLAADLNETEIEAALNEIDKLGLATIPQIKRELARMAPRPGRRALRDLLGRLTFSATDSELEREFLRLLKSTTLPKPHLGARLNGHKTDFFWPELGIVVETDGAAYHRTPAQQQADRIRDQDHAAAGLTPLRFTHWQVFYDKPRVAQTLEAVARRSSSARTKRSRSPSRTR
jgi:very-short-patch-repair endonuclease